MAVHHGNKSDAYCYVNPSVLLQVSQAASKLAKKVESLDLREANPKSARAVLSSIQ